MKLDTLKLRLCKFGIPQVVKEGLVFTVLITGKGLEKSETVTAIQELVLDYAVDKYPLIEAVKNEDEFFLIILKPLT